MKIEHMGIKAEIALNLKEELEAMGIDVTEEIKNNLEGAAKEEIRRIYSIDIGDLSNDVAKKYIDNLIEKHKNKLVYEPEKDV